jgi:uncharacterized protein (TIGR03643 family)
VRQHAGSYAPWVSQELVHRNDAGVHAMAESNAVNELAEADVSRIIEMAWEDRTPFDAISAAYKISEADVIKLMRQRLKRSSFEMWRKRVSGRATKHALLNPTGEVRHKANNRRHRGL